MPTLLNRYPGAQPFPDTEFSRRTFFGRERESIALTDQILANRLVVIYAKSGTGKSSLLNAGVAPRLREADSLPLMVRLNETTSTLLRSVVEHIRDEATRQQIEYVPGDGSSLWAFFKTAEFWRGDVLLKPVLVLDQFEELFTLWGDEERDKFLSELNFVIRGIAPPGTSDTYSNTAPTAHVVLSLREDFLGLLEEASDRIPQIMDHRFRVAPLTLSAAKTAMTCPAEVEAVNVATKPFRLDPGLVEMVMAYLSKSSSTRRAAGRAQIEPFHLQLICQRMERVAALKQQTSTGQVVLTANDFGGTTAFADTIATFYGDSIASLPDRRSRSTAQRLCEQYLISPEGRRLSLEERELQRQLGLSQEVLGELVDRRLLRTDRRSESTYYELSHDLLVEPVLASRRVQAMIMSWATIIAGAAIAVLAAGFLSVVILYAAFGKDVESNAWIGITALLPLFIGFFVLGVFWLRSGARRRKRYRPRLDSDLLQPLPVNSTTKGRAWAWIGVIAASGVFAVMTLLVLYCIANYLVIPFDKGTFPSWIAQDPVQDARDHPWVEIPSTLAQIFSVLVLGWVWLKRSIRKLWPDEFPTRSVLPGFREASLAVSSLKLIVGAYTLTLTALGAFAFGSCVTMWHGNIPHALTKILSVDVVDACIPARAHDWHSDGITTPTFWALAFIGSVVLIRSGLSDLQIMRRTNVLSRSPLRLQTAAMVAALLLVASVVYWTVPLIGSDHSGASVSERYSGGAAAVDSEPADHALVVGDKGTILEAHHPHVWTRQKSRTTSKLLSVIIDAPDSGWVGDGVVLLQTTDNGSHWETRDAKTTRLGAIAINSRQPGWETGDIGAATFKVRRSASDHKYQVVAYITPDHGFYVGENGTIAHTIDSGQSWTNQHSGTNKRLVGLAFMRPGIGWAVGDQGTIVHTDDAGRTWRLQNSGTVRNLRAIFCMSRQSCWAAGEKGAVLHTQDGGYTWRPQPTATRADLNDIVFTTEESGWAVGTYGTILHTLDGGSTWESQASGVREELESIAVARHWGSIGVRFATPAIKDDPNQPKHTPAGALVGSVKPAGPADQAGLKPGDIIASVNGKPVSNANDLARKLFVLQPGSDALLDCSRNGKEMIVHLTVSDRSKLYGAELAPQSRTSTHP